MKIICLLQARTNSSRLPGKIMKPLFGKPMIEHIINSVSMCKSIDEIVVVTTNTSRDDDFVEFLTKKNYLLFRGSENDVLTRYYKAAKKFEADYVIRITADNPLIDPRVIDHIVTQCLTKKSDYASNTLEKIILGYTVEVFSIATLEKLSQCVHDKFEREHVTLFVHRHKSIFNTQHVDFPLSVDPSWRLTVDTIEDFKLIEKIFCELYVENSYIKFEDVSQLLRDKPALLDINANVRQTHT